MKLAYLVLFLMAELVGVVAVFLFFLSILAGSLTGMWIGALMFVVSSLTIRLAYSYLAELMR